VEPKLKTPVKIHAAADVSRLVMENRGMVERLANIDGIEFVNESLAQMPGARTTPKFEVTLVYEKNIDPETERQRLLVEQKRLVAESERLQNQLNNRAFLEKAPKSVISGAQK